MTSPYLEPVATIWARITGIALLIAGATLTVVLVYAVFDGMTEPDGSRVLTSSSVIFGLILLALCGICWQAGYRLAFRRPDGSGMLFSRPAWFAIGTGLVVVVALMAVTILKTRRPTLVDCQVTLFLGGIGVWCLVLAFRRRKGHPGKHNGH